MLRLEVLFSQWTAGDQVFGGGIHEIAKPSKTLLGLIAAAEHAGAVVILEASREERAKLKGHVQSQADGEKAYAAAQESGRWQHGNLLDFVARKRNRLLLDDAVRAGDSDEALALTDDERAEVERQIAQAEASLEGIEVPT